MNTECMNTNVSLGLLLKLNFKSVLIICSVFSTWVVQFNFIFYRNDVNKQKEDFFERKKMENASKRE